MGTGEEGSPDTKFGKSWLQLHGCPTEYNASQTPKIIKVFVLGPDFKIGIILSGSCEVLCVVAFLPAANFFVESKSN